MRKTILLLVVSLFVLLGTTHSALAVDMRWNMGASALNSVYNEGGDGDASTSFFENIQYQGNTSSYANIDGTFTDVGNLKITSLNHDSYSVDTEGLNSLWMGTITWDNLAGAFSSVSFDVTKNEFTLKNVYSSGDMKFFVDDFSDAGYPDNGGTLGVADDTGFGTGVNVSTLGVNSGGVSYNELTYTYAPGFGFDSTIDPSTDPAGYAASLSAATLNAYSLFNSGALDPFGVSGDVAVKSGYFHVEATMDTAISNFWFLDNGTPTGTSVQDFTIEWVIGNTTGTNAEDKIVLATDDDGTYWDADQTQSRHTGRRIDSFHDGSLTVTTVPEPSTMMLIGFGLLFSAAVGRKRKS